MRKPWGAGRISGKVQELAGRIEARLGRMIGSPTIERSGKAMRIAGKARQTSAPPAAAAETHAVATVVAHPVEVLVGKNAPPNRRARRHPEGTEPVPRDAPGHRPPAR